MQVFLQRHADIIGQEVQHRVPGERVWFAQVPTQVRARRDQAQSAQEGDTAAIQKGIINIYYYFLQVILL